MESCADWISQGAFSGHNDYENAGSCLCQRAEMRSKAIRKPKCHILPLKIPLTAPGTPSSPMSGSGQWSYKALLTRACVFVCQRWGVAHSHLSSLSSIHSTWPAQSLATTHPGVTRAMDRHAVHQTLRGITFKNHANMYMKNVHASSGSVSWTNDTHAMALTTEKWRHFEESRV